MSVLTTKLRRDLGRNRAQFIAIAVTIFLGIVLFGGSFDAYRSLEASYEQLYDDLEFADLWVSGGDVEGFAQEVEALAGVAAVTTRYQADAGIRPVVDRSIYGRLVGMPAGEQPAVNQVLLLEGRYLDSADEALVDHHLAEHYDLKIGDVVEIAAASGAWQSFEVSGIVASAEYLWPAPSRQQLIATPDDFGVVFVMDETVVELAGIGAVAQAVVRFEDGSDVGEAVIGLSAEFGASDTYTAAEQPSNSALQQDVKGFGDLAFMFPMLFLTAAGLGAWVMLTRLVMTQLPVIGTLLANGMRRRRVFTHYLSYGVFVGLSGAIPGVILGALMAWGIAGVYTSAIDVPITVVKIDLSTPAIGLTFGVVAGLISAALPAWRAIRLSPAEALRGSRPTGVAKPTLLERIVPPLRRLSTERAMVLRNVVRNKRRTFTTMLGVVLALTLILVSWGMIDTVELLLERQFQQVERSDARVVLEQPADSGLLSELGAIDGVAVVEPSVSIPVAIEANGERYGTSLEAFVTSTSMHGFLGPDGAVDLPAEGILVGQALEGILGISPGSQVVVRVPSLDLAVATVVVGFVDEPMGTFAYSSLNQIETLVAEGGLPMDQLAVGGFQAAVLLQFDDGVVFDDLRSELEAAPGAVAVVSSRSIERMVDSIMGFFYVFVGVMLIFGGLLAFGIIFNTMSVNLAERQVEVATMEAAGISEGRIASLITTENVLVTLVAIVPGLILGFGIAQEFMAAYESDQFTFTLSMRSTTLVVSAAFILVVTLLSQLPGLRAIRRLDIAKIVRERAV